MELKIKDFFNPLAEGIVSNKKKFHNILIDGVKRFADTLAKTTDYGVYIFDYSKRELIYISDNIAQWCGISLKEIKRKGYDFYLEYIGEKDLKMLLEINNAALDFYKQLPENERITYSVSYDFHFGNFMIKQHFSPIVIVPNYLYPFELFAAETDCNKNVDFTFQDKKNEIKAYEWNFGDGNTSEEKSPKHLYQEAGVYKVSLKVTLNNGYKKTIPSRKIAISKEPKAPSIKESE
jgi:hypothetical protein